MIDAWADDMAEVIDGIISDALAEYARGLTAAADPAAFGAMQATWTEYVTGTAEPLVTGVFTSGAMTAWVGADTMSKAVAEAWPAVVHQEAVSYAKQASNRLAGVGNNVWWQVRSKVAKGVAEGWGTEQLKEQIEAKVPEFSEFRADTIARTETVGAFTNGDQAGAVALGEFGPVEKVWLATKDGRTREDHAAANGQVQPFAEPFMVGGVRMMHPHAPGAPAEQVVNCRCVALHLYPGDTRPDGSKVGERKATTTLPTVTPPKPTTATVAKPKPTPAGVPKNGWPNHAQARAYLEARHPHVEWGGDMAQWDRRMVRDTAEWADRMAARYPAQWSRMEYVGSQTGPIRSLNVPRFDWSQAESAYAHAYTPMAAQNGVGVIGINPRWAAQYDRFVESKQLGKVTNWSFGGSPSDTLTHEFGHIVDGITRWQVNQGVNRQFGQVAGFSGQVRLTGEGTFTHITNWLDNQAQTAMPKLGSTYGGKNTAEAFAESFLAMDRGLPGGAGRYAATRLDLTNATRASEWADGPDRDFGEQLSGMRVIDGILRSNGVRGRPEDWKRTMDALADAAT